MILHRQKFIHVNESGLIGVKYEEMNNLI